MHGSKETLPVALDADGYTSRKVEWGDMTIEFWTATADADPSEFFKGLPDDRCQCPHYGYLISGRITYRFGDREEVYSAGDVYYVAPGHLPMIQAGSEGIEFSPKVQFDQTMEVVGRNVQALMAGGV